MQFKKLKARRTLLVLLGALLLGLSLGAASGSLVAIVQKLTVREVDLGATLIASLGVLLAVLISYTVLRFPTGRRLAKYYDEKFGLGERVRTMIAFSDADGEIHKVQREDADVHLLSAVRASKLSPKLLLHLIAPVIAAALLLVAILLPVHTEGGGEPPVTDPDFNLSTWQEQALIDLIETVEASALHESPKAGVVEELQSLLLTLKSVKKVSAMKNAVISTVTAVNKEINDHNEYDLIGEKMRNTVNPAVIRLGAAVASLRGALLGEELDAIEKALAGESVYSQSAAIASSIGSALASSGARADGALYLALGAFADELDAISDSEATLSDTERDEAVKVAIGHAKDTVSSALLLESTNEGVRNTVVRRLLQIFGIKEDELPASERPKDAGTGETDGDYDDKDDDEGLNSGGLGSGDMVYGSDDTVYDPESGEYLTYGEVIDRYFAKVSEHFMDGNVPEELEELISAYFAALYNGDK
jgi:hypothetical protein